MKKEIIISMIVVIVVIIGNIVTQNYTKQCVGMVSQELVELKEEVVKEDKTQEVLKTKIEFIKEEWDNMQEKLAYYIEHDELEKVETQICLLKGNIEASLYREALPEIEKCTFILEHIQDKTALNVKNIF